MAILICFIVVIVILTIIFIVVEENSSSRGERSRRRTVVPKRDSNIHYGGKDELKTDWKIVNYILSSEDKLVTSLLIPTKMGDKAEIDAVIVSPKGVFCIEMKHWSGTIHGNVDDETWEHRSVDGIHSHEYKNPIKQNKRHCLAIKTLFGKKYYIENVVLFDGEAKVSLTGHANVYTVKQFKEAFEKLPRIIGGGDVNDIYDTLLKYRPTETEKREHDMQIENKYKNKA